MSVITDTVPTVPGIWIYRKRLISFLDFAMIRHDGGPFPALPDKKINIEIAMALRE